MQLSLRTLDMLYEDYIKGFQHERFGHYVINRINGNLIFSPIIDDFIWNERDAKVAYLYIKRLLGLLEK